MAVAALVVAGCARSPGRPAGPGTPATSAGAGPGPTATAQAGAPAPAPSRTVAGGYGDYAVSERQLTFTEPAHRTAAGESVGQRALVTQVWFPQASVSAGPFPVLLFAPGFQQCADDYAGLLRAWASAGYAVAAVNFPRTSCSAGAAAYEPDLVNQPADLSYALTGLLANSGQPHGILPVRLDPDEVAAAGQSDGGDTVVALATNTCCTDRRLKAMAVLSGAEWPMPGRYFTGPAPPALFVQGDADTINPPWLSLQLYRADDDGARYYLDLFGASHLAPYQGTGPVEQLVARVTLAFFDRYVLGQAAAQPAMTRDGDVAGTATLVSGGHLPP